MNTITVINLPAKRQLAFNEKLLAFHEAGDEADMNEFMGSCLDEKIIRIIKEV